jgi:chromosome segregation ATPase
MPPDELTTTKLLIAQMERVSDQISGLPTVCAKLESVVGTTVDLEHRLREVASELRTRDEAQSKMIDDLREKWRELSGDFKGFGSKIEILQGLVSELKSDLGKRVTSLEQQVKATFDVQLRLSERMRELEAASGNPEFAEFRKTFEVLKKDVSLLPEMRIQLKDLVELLPWMKAAKWVIVGLAVVIVGWLGKVLIQLILTSGVTP